MKPPKHNRRKFLSSLSASTAGGLLINTLSPFASTAQTDPFFPTNEFCFEPGLVYLNTGTLGPCRRQTIEETKKAWEELETLPLKYYGKWGAEPLAEKTRATAARFFNCDISEIVITSSTTNGMNSLAQGLRLKAGDHIITTDQEHGGGILCWEYYQKYHGVTVDRIAVPPGENNAAAIVTRISDRFTDKTKLISISHVFSSTGLRVPVAEISSLARSKGVLCVVDGAQAAGAIQVDVKKLGCHAYATSGHKWLMGPKGTGILYLSNESRDIIRPMQFEESYNTYVDSNGVVNSAAILGLGKAIEYIESIGIKKIEQYDLLLRNRLYDRLSGMKNLTIVSPPPGPLASPMLACLLPDSIERVAFNRMLYDKYKLSIRATHKQWFNGIRFSCHIFNTEKEVDLAADVVIKEIGG